MKKAIVNKIKLPEERTKELLKILQIRFEKNIIRHKGLDWANIKSKLEANPEKSWSLNEMEETGGEPDVVDQDKKTANTFFTIVPQKAPKAEEVFVTIWNRLGLNAVA